MRVSTAEELAGRTGLQMVAPDDCPSQAEYITYFEPAIAVMQTEEALERIALELCLDSAAENIDYLEVRWAPRLHLRDGLSVEQVLRAVLSGLAAAPLQAVAIVCAMRQHAPEENVELARVAGAFAGRGVVGFDLAGDEARYPAAPHRPAFEAARAAGLRLTCHAGEAGEPSSVEEALDLGVERIAHGVIGAREPRIVERIRAEGVVLDMCPTANWKCKAVPAMAVHPLPGLVRAGVRCTISSDSRTVADTTLTHEFDLMSAAGMTDDELRRCNNVAYDSRFG
ncbi:MAG TPA: adenosine deaminase family protein [Candidatus Dormibacteraeota bacterium]|nr:adenosine deaminase family protein [Candidatus Dormibacteraeota bacterium]